MNSAKHCRDWTAAQLSTIQFFNTDAGGFLRHPHKPENKLGLVQQKETTRGGKESVKGSVKGRDAEASNPQHQAPKTQDKRAKPKELKTNQGHAL